MTKWVEIYKCEVCGNIIEVLHAGRGELVCCGKPMVLQVPMTASEEQGKEKHVPVVEKTATGVKVKVGSVAHPMEDKHYIEWIEVVTPMRSLIKFLKPGQAPEAEFDVKCEILEVREYCSVHGQWTSK